MPAPGALAVVPPRLKRDSAATYPDQALRERLAETRTVELVLEVGVEGDVEKATLVEPQGHGFDEAALAAAEKLVFEPATRDGVSVASRIKFRYLFAPPRPKLIGRVARQEDDGPIGGATVTVRDANGAEHTTLSQADGSFSVPDLLPGPVHLTVTAEGQAHLETDEQLAPGEETRLSVRLEPMSEPAPAGPSPETGPVEVVVRGQRPPREVTKRTLERAEIARIPGTNGDALRSLQNLPGVARPPPFSGALIVRGSAPQDTLIFVGGTAVPLVYHFGGLSSVIPTELLDKIDFYPGNYSAAFGRGMGGMVDVGLRDPKKDGLHGMAQADLIDTRLVVEGPIGKTGWNFLAAGRRSWFDVWLGRVLSATGAGVTTAPRYYDYQLMLQNDIDPPSSFRIVFFGSDDALEILNQNPSASNPTFGGDLGFHTSFWRIQAHYENKIADQTELRVTAAYGQDSIDIGLGANLINTTLHPFSTRAELSQKVGGRVTANVGVDLLYEPYDLTLQLPPPTRPGAPPGGPGQIPVQSRGSSTLFLPSAYAELEIVPWGGTRLVPGVRADYDSATERWDVAPRLNVRQNLSREFPRTTLKGAAGLFYEPPTPLNTDPNFGQTGLSSNRSIHYDIGFEQEFTRQVDLSTDFFYKRFDHLVIPGSGNSGEGFAYGAEVLLRYKSDERFFGWLSYTLSQSERRSLPTDPFALFQFDQTHILTVLGSYKLGRGWQVGGRFRLVSGNLYTPSEYGAYNATVGAQLAVTDFPPNGARLPLFQQLDLRADKTWAFQTWKLSAYLDVQNVYNAKNAEGVSYNYNYTQSAYVTGLPILPSLGVRAEF